MHRLLTSDEMRQADVLTIAGGTPGYDLMLRAGAAVAAAARAMLPGGGRILVLCGPGNNGGDGFVAARRLVEQGFSVEVGLLGARDTLKGDAALAAEAWTGVVADPRNTDPAVPELIVDALFGSGLARDLGGEARAVVERVNAAEGRVLAVDIPSGIDGDTGAMRGAAIKAERTVTFARRKPGHLLFPGRAHCGVVTVADIGITDETIAAVAGKFFANGPALWREAFPRPSLDAHKYKRGHALVLSGDATHTGAARLAARGALRVGAGLVTVGAPANALSAHAAQLTAIMLRRCEDAAELSSLLQDARFNAVALGPALGIGRKTRQTVRAALKSDRAVVLDADALTSFEESSAELAKLMARRPVPAVLTPHEGEFARVFGEVGDAISAPSKLHRALRAAAVMQSVVVLKGPDTVVAAPDGRAAINENATPYLATAGAGDVLTGIIAGLLAQRMPAWEAACAGVWLHAEAGRRFGPGLIAEDIPEALPGVLREL